MFHFLFPTFSRLRKTSFPCLWNFCRSFLALQTALSAHPLEWGQSGLLVTWVHRAAKSYWLVISLPLSDMRVASEVTSRSRSISYQPELESASTKYCWLHHSEKLLQFAKADGCGWSGSFCQCDFVLVHWEHDCISLLSVTLGQTTMQLQQDVRIQLLTQ